MSHIRAWRAFIFILDTIMSYLERRLVVHRTLRSVRARLCHASEREPHWTAAACFREKKTCPAYATHTCVPTYIVWMKSSATPSKLSPAWSHPSQPLSKRIPLLFSLKNSNMFEYENTTTQHAKNMSMGLIDESNTVEDYSRKWDG
jgi:hypothetical protein